MIEIIENIAKQLTKFGYKPGLIIKDGSSYDFGINYVNSEIDQRISIAFYEVNPLTKLESESALFIRIFKSDDYFDLSRYAEMECKYLDRINGQYFVFDKNNNKFIAQVFEYLFSLDDVLSGKIWIKIDYNLKDDY